MYAIIPRVRLPLPALLLAALPAFADMPKEDAKAVAAADKLYDFLRDAEIPKEKSQDVADRYEDFRTGSSAEREKTLRAVLLKPAFKGRPALADMNKALSRMDMGPGVRDMTSDKLRRQRLENEALQEKDVQAYEALLDTPSRRAALIKHCGITKEEDIRAIEPYVFPGLEVREALKALGAALKAKGVDAQDAAWVADACHEVWARYYKPKVPSADDGDSGGESGGGSVPAPPKKPRRRR